MITLIACTMVMKTWFWLALWSIYQAQQRRDKHRNTKSSPKRRAMQ